MSSKCNTSTKVFLNWAVDLLPSCGRGQPDTSRPGSSAPDPLGGSRPWQTGAAFVIPLPGPLASPGFSKHMTSQDTDSESPKKRGRRGVCRWGWCCYRKWRFGCLAPLQSSPLLHVFVSHCCSASFPCCLDVSSLLLKGFVQTLIFTNGAWWFLIYSHGFFISFILNLLFFLFQLPKHSSSLFQ